MIEDLVSEELALEKEARGITIKRFRTQHLKGEQDSTYSETFLGKNLVKSYLQPFALAVEKWVAEASQGRSGPRATAVTLIEDVDPYLISFLTLKGIFNSVGIQYGDKQPSLTFVARTIAEVIHEEIRLAEFEREHKSLSDHIHKDFNARELAKYKKQEYVRKAFEGVGMEWAAWTLAEKIHLGSALVHLFIEVTGDLEIESRTKKSKMFIKVSIGLLQALEDASDQCEAMFSRYYPMVVPPNDWTPDNLEGGGYLSEDVRPYPLVKSSKPEYRNILRNTAKQGNIDKVLQAVNVIQRTPWSINKRVLEVVEKIYDLNIPCGKLPNSDQLEIEPPPFDFELVPKDDPQVRKYLGDCARIHEANRRVVAKRVMATKAFRLAHKFAQYEKLYFPHDMDSRGRVYPKPTVLNPQGPDYVKGLLQFAEGKPLGDHGYYWLAVHGANSFGEDKLPMMDRYLWAVSYTTAAQEIADDPLGNLSWTKADHPVQFLAWCFEWAECNRCEHSEDYVSHLHVDLDATCSGLQHFSAMLRDEVGAFHVNMKPSDTRQDVYQAVADAATKLIEQDITEDTDHSQLAHAWVDFGLTRSITKRPVMIKPYAGTNNACVTYVCEAVQDEIKSGREVRWPKENLFEFQRYGANKVWKAIPEIIVAADEAMRWLGTIARVVGKSQPDKKRIEWVTPLGLPVHQSKFKLKSRRIKTKFNGQIITPKILEETDELSPRDLASTVAPSFVHSLDACHLQATVSAASERSITNFAVVHDSFGTHACDIPELAKVIRQEFVDMYSENDVLQDFYDSNRSQITEKFEHEIPLMPERGSLDLQGILENEFFFS